MNKVLLIGHVGKTPEIRYLETPDHPKVAQFTLATTEARKAKDGTVTKLTEWHNIVAWRGVADFVEKYIQKGSQVFIEGKLRTRSWDANGQKVYRTEIIAENLQFVGRKPEDNGQQPLQQAPGMWNNPQQQQRTQFVPPAQEISYEQPTDDLPF